MPLLGEYQQLKMIKINVRKLEYLEKTQTCLVLITCKLKYIKNTSQLTTLGVILTDCIGANAGMTILGFHITTRNANFI